MLSSRLGVTEIERKEKILFASEYWFFSPGKNLTLPVPGPLLCSNIQLKWLTFGRVLANAGGDQAVLAPVLIEPTDHPEQDLKLKCRLEPPNLIRA